MNKKTIGVFVGSLRKDSYSRKVAECVIKLAPSNFEMKIIEIGQLPLYNQDYDDTTIAAYDDFRAIVKSLDAVLFVTPEHNRSIPAALKNALDVASRPWGQNVWSKKPAGVISQSISSLSGFGANHHLRQVLSFLDTPTMLQPECYLANIADSIDENGKLTSERTVKFLQTFMDAYINWVNLICKS